MKDKMMTVMSKALIKVGNVFNGNVSFEGYYKPKKVK